MNTETEILPSKRIHRPGPVRRNMILWFLIVQSLAFGFLLVVTWVDEELLIPAYFAHQFSLTSKTMALILDSVWIVLMFVFTISYQMKSWRHIKLLEGIIPICSYCKKIRDPKMAWVQLEEYISDHSEADFSHSICPSCGEKHFGEYMPKDKP